MPAKQPASVVQLFQRRSSPVAEVPIASHSTLPCDTEPADAVSAVDLTGRPKVIVAVGEGNVGKAQPDDSPVLTPTGFRPIGDLHVGDMVTCPDGTYAAIMGVFPQGEKDIYQVEFRDGRTVECCDEHLWKVWRPKNTYETGKSHAERRVMSCGHWEIRPLLWIMEAVEKGRGSARQKRRSREISIPLASPLAIEFPPQDLPISPYALGALLGDGGMSHSLDFTSADQDVLEKLGAELGGFELRQRPGNNGYGWNVCMAAATRDAARRQRTGSAPPRHPLKESLRSLGLMGKRSHEKFVPQIYKIGSVSQRIALLQGLMDTDGSAGRTGASLTTTSKQLAEDVQWVAWSLGGIAKISARQTYCTYKGERVAGKPSWRVAITLPDASAIFSLPRKLSLIQERTKDRRLTINKITYVGKKHARCIAVNHPDHLYVTNQFVVTHNTLACRWLVETSLRRGAEPPILAALDTNRSLAQYFENVAEPDGNYEAAKVTLLEALIQHAMAAKTSVVLDLGGNDTSLGHVVSAFPGLADTLEDAGVSPVLLYVLSPRVYDLTALSTLEAAGFRPRATAIVLNEGVADVTRGRGAFDAVLAHSVYRAAVARGVVPLWMPRLEPAQEIELARIHFWRAAGGLSQEQREQSPLGPFDRTRVQRWLEKMDKRFAPIGSWLP